MRIGLSSLSAHGQAARVPCPRPRRRRAREAAPAVLPGARHSPLELRGEVSRARREVCAASRPEAASPPCLCQPLEGASRYPIVADKEEEGAHGGGGPTEEARRTEGAAAPHPRREGRARKMSAQLPRSCASERAHCRYTLSACAVAVTLAVQHL
ncbi:unnamed protein product [Prorocentrum cordatum]|uniref:Uncharacterized protein n=1 Tax=Prorocentrum cordatum TaxID=2364126 RepID=A0ABN9VS84_9DINO|nr:unnamed protein product [Polarella glacialis]